jgi:hypothetical protein
MVKSMDEKRAYPPQSITTKNDEMISISKVKRMDIWGCNKTHLHNILFLRSQDYKKLIGLRKCKCSF